MGTLAVKSIVVWNAMEDRLGVTRLAQRICKGIFGPKTRIEISRMPKVAPDWDVFFCSFCSGPVVSLGEV